MNGLADIFPALLLATNLMLAVSSRLSYCIRIVAFQGLILGLIPLLAVPDGKEAPELILTSLITVAVKCVILPLLLSRAVRQARVKREIEPFVGYSASALIVIVVTILSFWLCSGLVLPPEVLSILAVPSAISTMFTGLFLIVTRRKAITQALGFLVFENGICAFGLGLMLKHGLIVELGILLDVLVLVFVMGITVFHIRREFQHIDADKLKALGDFEEDVTLMSASEGEKQ